MPAVSKQQQKLMGIVRALQTGAMKPGKASKQAQSMAKSMKPSDVEKFAATKHKGLPKKVKKEEMAIPTMFLVRKPMDGMTAEKMVCEINPLEGIQPLNINMNDVHSVHATAEDAQQIAGEAYQKYCDEAIALEEKKDTTSGKIKKAIDQLEKKRKEHLTLAKDDPKSASKHKEHIAKIATQIDDLMTKLERIEKSKKQIEKEEDKKELKEADDKKMDISFVKDIHDEETLLSKFPKAKKLYDKVSHGFWDLNGDKKIFARVDFKQSGEGTKVGDFDPSSFDISTVYKMVGKDKHGLGEPVYLYKKGLKEASLKENTKHTELKPLEDILIQNGYKFSGDDAGFSGKATYKKKVDDLNTYEISLFKNYEGSPVRILYFVSEDYTFSNGKKMNRGQADISYKSIEDAKKDLEGVSKL